MEMNIWQKLEQADRLATLEINSWHSAFTDPIWEFFSDIPVWIPMYVMIAALLFWRLGWKKGFIVLAAALLTFGFCDQFSNLVKHAVARIRPLNDGFMLEHGLHVLEKAVNESTQKILQREIEQRPIRQVLFETFDGTSNVEFSRTVHQVLLKISEAL